jgi:tetratricopeptide (TPR) repeat protein
MLRGTETRWLWLALASLLAIGCGGDDDDKSTTAGGKAGTSGGEQADDEQGGQQGSEGGGAWSSGDEDDSGEPLPPRRAMSSGAQGYYQDGVEAARAGKTQDARNAFQRALQADSSAYKAAYNLGVLADRSGQESKALEYYRQALKIQPDYELAAEGIVTIYLRKGQKSSAISFIQPLANRWVRNLHLQALNAEVLAQAGRYDDATEAARKALRRDERFVPAMVAVAKASLAQGRKELAESILDQALAIDDKHAELHYLKGRLLLAEAGRLREALDEFRKAVELRPDYVEARMSLGVQLLAGANYDEALQQFQAAERLAPQLVSVHLNLGDAYRATKQWQKAKAEFEKALQMRSTLPEAHFNLGLMYMTAGSQLPGTTQLEALQRAQQQFRRYRDQMGPKLTRDDPSDAYLRELDRQIEREQRRVEREKERAQRASATGAGDAGTRAATPDAGTK